MNGNCHHCGDSHWESCDFIECYEDTIRKLEKERIKLLEQEDRVKALKEIAIEVYRLMDNRGTAISTNLAPALLRLTNIGEQLEAEEVKEAFKMADSKEDL